MLVQLQIRKNLFPDKYRPDNYHIDHLEEEIRCRDEIQLLEGPILLVCPWCAVFVVSVGNMGFGAFLFEKPARENEVDGMCASLTICREKL